MNLTKTRKIICLFLILFNKSYSQITTYADTAQKQEISTTVVKQNLRFTSGDSDFSGSIIFRPEIFYTKNLTLLNNNIPEDITNYFFYTLDLIGSYAYGHASRGYNVITTYINLRSQSIWANPGFTISTTENDLESVNSAIGAHRHEIPHLMPWIRELWMSICLSDLLCLPFCHMHVITVGAFPFQLGRGISLGVTHFRRSEPISVNSAFFIRQYIFGIAISGIAIKDKLLYDLYGGFLNNFSDSFELNSQHNLKNIIGHRRSQAVGFGDIDYVIAARLRWVPVAEIKPKPKKIYVEPYALYAYTPHEPFTFETDFERHLVTIGTAAEFIFDKLGFGFDTAFNMGQQLFKGIDRNEIVPSNFLGFEARANSEVFEFQPPLLFNAFDRPVNQNIIDNSVQAQSQNGKIIGVTQNSTLFNSATRFRKTNQFKLSGSMFVFDIGYFIKEPEFKINFTTGFASGGTRTCPKQDFEGFIPINENYFGVRVKSIYVPLAIPGFTNLFLVGAGVDINPQSWCKKWIFNANVLGYWEDDPTLAFDVIKNQNSPFFARQFLGSEINLLSQVELFKSFYFFTLTAIFFPGSHFDDIKGRPISDALNRRLSRLNRTGTSGRILRQGNDVGYILNAGFQYTF